MQNKSENKHTCAVVGSGDSVLECEFGKLIEQHDIVIRCNRAVTKGYEEHVGTRTDYRVLCNSVTRSLCDKKYYLRKSKASLEWKANAPAKIIQSGETLVIFRRQMPTSAVQRLSVRGIKIIDFRKEFSLLKKSLGLASPTSGTIAIWLAHHTFGVRDIRCFGFDQYRRPTEEKMNHYYETLFHLPPSGHDFLAEYEFNQEIGVKYITKENYNEIQT